MKIKNEQFSVIFQKSSSKLVYISYEDKTRGILKVSENFDRKKKQMAFYGTFKDLKEGG